MDLLGIEVERRPAADRGPVELRRRSGADQRPGSSRRRGEVVAAERLEERRGRPDRRASRTTSRTRSRSRLGRDRDHRRDRPPTRSGPRASARSGRSSAPRRCAARSGPEASAVAQDLGVRGHERRVGVEPGEERLEALGRVGRLELGQLRAGAAGGRPSGRRPRSWWRRWSSSSIWRSAMTSSMSRVIRSSVGRPSVAMAAASRRRPLHERPGAGAAGRARVLEPVGVALVAVERGGRRIELEDRLPRSGRRGR